MVTSIGTEQITGNNDITKRRDDWRIVKFGNVVNNVDISERNPLENGLERYIGLDHIDPESLHIKRWGLIEEGTSFTRKFIAGQVLFGKRRAYQRKVAIAEFDGICSGDILVFEAKNGLLPELLPFIVQSDGFYEHALGTSAGSLSPRTRWRDLADYEFALPSKDEQRRIADILWAVDDLAGHLLLVLSNLSKLEDLVSSKFFDDTDNYIRSLPCSVLCNEITVGIVVTPAKYYVPSGVPALRSINVLPDKFVLDDLVHISELGHLQHSKSQLHEGDVVIVRSGRPGEAAVITRELDGANCIDLIIARPGKSLRAHYLCRFLNSSAGRRQLEKRTAGTAQKHVNAGELKNLNIPAPPLDIQDRIVAELDMINHRIKEVKQHILHINRLKSYLKHQLLAG